MFCQVHAKCQIDIPLYFVGAHVIIIFAIIINDAVALVVILLILPFSIDVNLCSTHRPQENLVRSSCSYA